MLDALPYRGDGRVRPARLALPPGRCRARRAPPAQALALRRRLRPRADAVRRHRARRRAAARRSGRCGTARRERLRERTVAAPRAAVDAARRRACACATATSRSTSSSSRPARPSRSSAATARSYIWTRKRPVARARARTLDGPRVAVDAPGLVDDTAGYHARHTAWEWCAGRRASPTSGAAVVWNLVAGVHDAPRAQRAHGVGRRRRRARSGPVRVRRRASTPCGDLRFTRRGRARAPRRPAARRQRLPPAVRHASPARCPAAPSWPRATASWSATARAGESARRPPTRSPGRCRSARRPRRGPAAPAGARAARSRPGRRSSPGTASR